MKSSKKMKWMSFKICSILLDEGIAWDLIWDKTIPTPALGDNVSAEDRQEHRELTQEKEAALAENKKRNNHIWCYLAGKLDSCSLMLISHDCVNEKSLGDGQKAWRILK